jgi:hypothetical protein
MSTARNQPALSVIVPMYQSGATVARTIESILVEHVDGDFEVVLVNDGSTDDGLGIVESLVRADPRLRVISQPNAGLAAARNTGIDAASGRWLRFVDADDWVSPGSSQRLIDCADRQALPACCAAQELTDDRGVPLDRLSPALGGPDGTIGIEHFLDSNRCGVGTVVLDAAALGSDRFDPALRVCEDWDLWLRLCARGVRFAVCPGEPVLSYRVRQASLSKDFSAMLRTGQDVLRRAYASARRLRLPNLDCSAQRERIALHRAALQWATVRAVSDRPGRVEEAAEMFASSGGRPFDSSEAAAAAVSAALVGLGIRPEAENDASVRWLERTADWWAACAERSEFGGPWFDRAAIDSAWRTLAEMVVLPMDIARACVREARLLCPADPIVIGAGANGRLLARAAAEHGLAFSLRDDRLDAGNMGPADLPPGVHTQPMDAPIDTRRCVVISAGDDRVLFERFRAYSPVRWSVVRHSLAASILDRTRHFRTNPRITPLAIGESR